VSGPRTGNALRSLAAWTSAMFTEFAFFIGLTMVAAVLWRYRVLRLRRLWVLGVLLVVLLFGWIWWRNTTSLRDLTELV